MDGTDYVFGLEVILQIILMKNSDKFNQDSPNFLANICFKWIARVIIRNGT